MYTLDSFREPVGYWDPPEDPWWADLADEIIDRAGTDRTALDREIETVAEYASERDVADMIAYIEQALEENAA